MASEDQSISLTANAARSSSPLLGGARKPTHGPVADASRREVCETHHEKECRAAKPDGPIPYWQYLERLNRRYGGAVDAAPRRARDSVELSAAARAFAATFGPTLGAEAADRGGYRLPRLGDIPTNDESATAKSLAAKAPLHAKVEQAYVMKTPGTRVDAVV